MYTPKSKPNNRASYTSSYNITASYKWCSIGDSVVGGPRIKTL